ncbi:MAG: lipid II flippase MurJ [Bacteriovoracia bacterium]
MLKRLSANKVMRNSALLSVGLLVGRCVGYVRELIISSKFGAGTASDQVILSLTLPELMSSMLATGLAVKLIVPRLHGLGPNDELAYLNHAWRKVFRLALIGFGVFVPLSFWAYGSSLAPLLVFSAVSIGFNSMTAITSSFLHKRESFFSQATSNLAFNVVATTGIFLSNNILIIIGFFILASLARFQWVWREAKNLGATFKIFRFSEAGHVGRPITTKSLVFAFVGASMPVMTPLVNRLFASVLPPGTVSILSYAEKLYVLPLTLLIGPVMTASFPGLVSEIKGVGFDFKKFMMKTLKPAGLISALIVFCYLLAPYIVAYSYGLTGISVEVQRHVTDAFVGFLPCLLFSAFSMFTSNILFSLEREATVFLTAAIALALNLMMSWLATIYGSSAASLAYAASISAFVLFVVQLQFLVRLDRRFA